MKTLPFGNRIGFGPGGTDEYYYSQGFTRGQFGPAVGNSITKRKDSDDIAGLDNIKFFAQVSTKVYAQDSAGDIYREDTAGALDFGAAIRTPGGNGCGLLGDQKGRLLYGNGASNNQIGMYDLTTWTDGWIASIESWQHPMDKYEDYVVYGNKWKVGLIDSADASNDAALTLPSAFTVDCLRSGKTGVLLGVNLVYEGILILWNPFQAARALAPWLWTNGKVLSIERYGADWIVVTTKEIILTNGYSSQKLFSFLDDPFGFSSWNVNPQGTIVVNDKLFILQQKQTTQQTNEFGRMKPGVYIFDIPTRTFEYVPVNTLNSISISPLAIFLTSSYSKSIVLGFTDAALSKNYISSIGTTPSPTAVLVSEELGEGVSEKVAKTVMLNLGLLSSVVDVQTLTFDVSVKLYNFKRQLWGKQTTNAVAADASHIRVDGTAGLSVAQVGDEVTVLSGNNAGGIRHITAIANQGASNETWTLNSALSNTTGSSIYLNVQPFKLLSKKTVSAATEITNLRFEAKNRIRGEKFLVKVVIENLTTAQVEIHPSVLLVEDLGLPNQ